MGGLATVAAVGILALMAIQLFQGFYDTTYNSEGLLIGALDANAARQAETAGERISISGIGINFSGPPTTMIKSNVSNIGGQSIAARNFSKMDVILTYTPVSSPKLAVMLSYDPTGLIANSWKVFDVFTGTRHGEVINPIAPLPAATSGEWDPGEVLEIQLSLALPMDCSQGASLVVVSPGGDSASLSR